MQKPKSNAGKLRSSKVSFQVGQAIFREVQKNGVKKLNHVRRGLVIRIGRPSLEKLGTTAKKKLNYVCPMLVFRLGRPIFRKTLKTPALKS